LAPLSASESEHPKAQASAICWEPAKGPPWGMGSEREMATT
jgi:hypothetical protein